MRKMAAKLSLILLMGFLSLMALTNQGCKSEDDSFDITSGSWAVFCKFNNQDWAYVYSFRGNKQSGEVFYSEQKRGTYTVSGSTVQFTLTHYDVSNNSYTYNYSGVYSDTLNMKGSISVNYPDGSKKDGSWRAER